MEARMFHLLVFIFGTMIGSFLNVCIARIPSEESIFSPPSHYPKCKAAIPVYCNISLLSFAFLRGCCRYCSERISVRYFLVELLMDVLALALFARFRLS